MNESDLFFYAVIAAALLLVAIFFMLAQLIGVVRRSQAELTRMRQLMEIRGHQLGDIDLNK